MDMKSLRERCRSEEAALRVRCLAQRHFGSALKTPQHLSFYQPTSHFLGPSNGSCTRHLWLPAPPPSESEQPTPQMSLSYVTPKDFLRQLGSRMNICGIRFALPSEAIAAPRRGPTNTPPWVQRGTYTQRECSCKFKCTFRILDRVQWTRARMSAAH